MAQIVKCLPTVWETRVRSLGWEDPLEKAMAPHSSTLAWKIPWTEEPGTLGLLAVIMLSLISICHLVSFLPKKNC